MSGDNWNLLSHTTLYLVLVLGSGQLCKMILVPAIVGEIIFGMIVGPDGFNLFPSINAHIELLSTLGTIGVTLIIMESGTHVSFRKILHLGWRVWSIGIIGTILPMVGAIFVFYGLGYPLYPDSFSAAIIVTPASVGVAMKVLITMRKLNTDYGQAIIIAAYEDDLAALILFIILKTLFGSNVNAGSVIAPVGGAIGFILVSCLMATWVFPPLFRRLFYPLEHRDDRSYNRRDWVHSALIILFVCGMSWIGHQIGSHLLGAFLAGIIFSKVIRTSTVWDEWIKPILSWLLRLFFASTVAFSIPVQIMMTWDSFKYGLLVGLVCIVTKMIPAMILPARDRWKVGWALVGRGEFSYLIAEFVLKEDKISLEMFAIIVWALLICTLSSPCMLQLLIRRSSGMEKYDATLAYRVEIEGLFHVGIEKEVSKLFDEMGYTVKSSNTNMDRRVAHESFIILPRDGHPLSEETMAEIKKQLCQTFGDPDLQVKIIKECQITKGQIRFDIMGDSNVTPMIGIIRQGLTDDDVTLTRPHWSDNNTRVSFRTAGPTQLTCATRNRLKQFVDTRLSTGSGLPKAKVMMEMISDVGEAGTNTDSDDDSSIRVIVDDMKLEDRTRTAAGTLVLPIPPTLPPTPTSVGHKDDPTSLD